MKLYTVFYLVGYRPYMCCWTGSRYCLWSWTAFNFECLANQVWPANDRVARALLPERPPPRGAGGAWNGGVGLGSFNPARGDGEGETPGASGFAGTRPIVGTRPMAEAKRRLPVRMPRRPNPASLDAPTTQRDCSRPARNRYLPPRRPPPRRPRRPQASHGERALSGPRATRRQVCRAAAVVPRSPRPSGSMLFIGCSSHPPNGAPT